MLLLTLGSQLGRGGRTTIFFLFFLLSPPSFHDILQRLLIEYWAYLGNRKELTSSNETSTLTINMGSVRNAGAIPTPNALPLMSHMML